MESTSSSSFDFNELFAKGLQDVAAKILKQLDLETLLRLWRNDKKIQQFMESYPKMEGGLWRLIAKERIPQEFLDKISDWRKAVIAWHVFELLLSRAENAIHSQYIYQPMLFKNREGDVVRIYISVLRQPEGVNIDFGVTIYEHPTIDIAFLNTKLEWAFEGLQIEEEENGERRVQVQELSSPPFQIGIFSYIYTLLEIGLYFEPLYTRGTRMGEEVCSNCKKEGEFECGACFQALYCSEKCQKEDWLDSHKELCEKMLTSKKARKILKEGKAHGRPLTARQKRFFGWVAGGRK